MNRASIMALLDTVLLRSLRIGVDPIVASAVLTVDQLGDVVVDATAGPITVTLPSSSAALRGVEVTLRRKDMTSNVLSIIAPGTDKIFLPGAAADGIPATELIFSGDYLTLRADGVGRWWCVGQPQLPPSISSIISRFSTAGIQTYVVPAVFRSGRRRASVTVVGGGGGGAHAESATVGGGGGGGGGRGRRAVDLYGIASVVVTIGSGGLGGTSTVSAGKPGATSSFGEYISTTGGGGGSTPTGGDAGVVAGDDVVNLPVSASTPGAANVTGSGGGPGGGGSAITTAPKGRDGAGAGGGGAGGGSATGTRGGGNGKDGEVLVEVA